MLDWLFKRKELFNTSEKNLLLDGITAYVNEQIELRGALDERATPDLWNLYSDKIDAAVALRAKLVEEWDIE